MVKTLENLFMSKHRPYNFRFAILPVIFGAATTTKTLGYFHVRENDKKLDFFLLYHLLFFFLSWCRDQMI